MISGMQTISFWLVGSPAAWILLAVAARLLYLSGVGILLHHEATTHRSQLRYGSDTAFKRFRLFARGVMYTDGICLFLLSIATSGTLTVFPQLLSLALGGVFIAIGIGMKLWATKTLGTSGFYWHDFFMPDDKNSINLSKRNQGPYRYIKNPMYGIGNLHIIGWALVWQSTAGLIVGIVAIVALHIFYLSVEAPHVRRIIEKTV